MYKFIYIYMYIYVFIYIFHKERLVQYIYIL